MKKKLIILIFTCFAWQCMAFSETICGIGVKIEKDPYSKKIFILEALPNSNALQYRLPDGAEIISVNDIKTKRLNIGQVSNLIRGEEGSTVKLTIKYDGHKRIYNIPRGKFTVPEKKQDQFEIHWRQVAPVNMCIEPIPQNMLKI